MPQSLTQYTFQKEAKITREGCRAVRPQNGRHSMFLDKILTHRIGRNLVFVVQNYRLSRKQFQSLRTYLYSKYDI